MYGWHRIASSAAYVVILCHPLALALDGWAQQPALAWAVLAPWQQSWPGWLGWLALLCLMAGMGSAFASRTPYSTWRRLHWLLAVAVVLAVAHLSCFGWIFPCSGRHCSPSASSCGASSGRITGWPPHHTLSARCARRPGILSKFGLHPCPGRLTPAPGAVLVGGLPRWSAFSRLPRVPSVHHQRPRCAWRAVARHQGPGRLHASTCSHWSRALPPASRGPFGDFLSGQASRAEFVDCRRYRHHPVSGSPACRPAHWSGASGLSLSGPRGCCLSARTAQLCPVS